MGTDLNVEAGLMKDADIACPIGIGRRGGDGDELVERRGLLCCQVGHREGWKGGGERRATSAGERSRRGDGGWRRGRNAVEPLVSPSRRARPLMFLHQRPVPI